MADKEMREYMKARTTVLFVVIIAVIASIIGMAVTAEGKNNDETYTIITDGEGKFYELKNTGGNSVMKSYSKSGSNGNMLINNFKADYCLTCKGKTVIVGNNGKTLTVIKYPQGPDMTNYIENVELKERCIAISKDMCIYLVDNKNHNTVKKYDKLIYEDDPIDTGMSIQYLFTENISGKVFAVTSDGIFDTQERRFIKCSIPQYPIKGNAGYYSDQKGDIYKFDERSGFNKVISIKSNSVCTMKNCLLYKDGNKIIRSAYSGEITGIYTCNSDIDGIYTSGNDIAWTHNKNISFISEDDFIKSNPESNNNDNSDNNSKHENITVKSLSLYSDTYNISNDTITGIPQKTKAGTFLKNIRSDNADIVLKDNNGNRTETGYVGTGWSVELSDGQKTKRYDIIIKGDVNGDGVVDSGDIKKLFMYIDNTDSINKLDLLAADCNNDGITDTIDLFMIHNIAHNKD